MAVEHNNERDKLNDLEAQKNHVKRSFNNDGAPIRPAGFEDDDDKQRNTKGNREEK